VSDAGTRFRWASAAGYACGARGSGQDPDFSSLPASGSRGRLAAGPLHVRRHSRAATGVIPPGAGVPLSCEAQPMAYCVGMPAQARAVTLRGTLVWASAPFKRGGPARDRGPVGIQSRGNAVAARRTSVCAAARCERPVQPMAPGVRTQSKASAATPRRALVWTSACSQLRGRARQRAVTPEQISPRRLVHACTCRACKIPCAGVSSCRAHTSHLSRRQRDAALPSVRGPRRR
jgi:hypothetical protein